MSFMVVIGYRIGKVKDMANFSMARKVGATTKFIAPSNKRGARIKVTMAGRSKIVSKEYCNDEHVQAIVNAWEFFEFGTLGTITYVAESESGRGSVYVVTYEDKGREG